MVEIATPCSTLSITLPTFQPSGRKMFSSSYRRYQPRTPSKSKVSWQGMTWASFPLRTIVLKETGAEDLFSYDLSGWVVQQLPTR